MLRPGSSLRTISLLASASLAVHELRYLAEYGTGAGRVLAEEGHGYLPLVATLIAVGLGVSAVRFASAALQARRGAAAAPPRASFGALWMRSTLALVAVYILQEGIEGAFSLGHPAGIVAVLGHGGWTAIFFAGALGAVVAGLLRGGDLLLARLARRAETRPRPRPARTMPRPVARLRARAGAPLARHLAGRAPPLTS
jgi:hypothetical protein